MNDSTPGATDANWIFGYGSLIWRPGFAHLERRPAEVRGHSRRFWQGSPDHRGVPGRPGRVVTLVVAKPEARCVGAAYRVADAALPGILATLDHREKAGYERWTLPVFAPDAVDDPPFARALIFAAAPGNSDWLGPAPVGQMAQHIATRSGPSGTNLAYLEALATALDAIGHPDPHVTVLRAAAAAAGAQ